jgi:hypothetical protein
LIADGGHEAADYFVVYGGFLYFEGVAAASPCAAATIAPPSRAHPPALHFRKPRKWDGALFTAPLDTRGRFQTVTIGALRDACAQYYCWVHPGEVLLRGGGGGGGGDGGGGGGATEAARWEAPAHGAFVYLFREDKQPDPRDVYFPLWSVNDHEASLGAVALAFGRSSYNDDDDEEDDEETWAPASAPTPRHSPPAAASAVEAAAPQLDTDTDPAAVSRLVEYGFSCIDAVATLRVHGGDEEAALNQLLMG